MTAAATRARTGASTAGAVAGSAAERRWWPPPRPRLTLLAVIAITLLAWQPVGLSPGPGLDLSWTAGLSMAVHDGLSFGTRTVFTYGPLGFLAYSYIWYSTLGLLAFIYLWLLRLGLAWALYAGLRRSFGPVVSFVVAVVAATVVGLLVEPVIVLIAMVGALNGPLPGRRPLLLAGLAGALAAAEFLNKVSVGSSIAVMTAVFVISLPRRRRESALVAFGSAAASLLVLWLATGQQLSALPDYFTRSEQIVSGYAAAMELSAPGLGWEIPAAILVVGLGLWGALHMTARPAATTRERLGTVGLWLVFCYFAFKEGFVRHESGHAALFFGAVLGGYFAFAWRRTYRVSALAGAAALLIIVLADQSGSLGQFVHPVPSARAAITDTHDVLSSSRRAAIIASGRSMIKTSEPVDARALSLLRGHTVAIYPSELALAWAYRLQWDPLPVLQSYSAYTTRLDSLDAQFLVSARAPQRILIGTQPSIDQRVPSFDEPAALRTMLCRYRELYASASSAAVLGLGANRCSNSRFLSAVRAGWGQTVAVPAPPDTHSLVAVRISGVGISGLESLKALLYRPVERFIAINGAMHRLVTGTAGDGLPLRAAPGVDYPAPFSVAVGATSIAVFKQGQTTSGGQPIRYSFYAEEVG